MAIKPSTPGIHHINLRCTSLAKSKTFYRDKLGFTIAIENDELFAFAVGGVFIVFKTAEPGLYSTLIPLVRIILLWPAQLKKSCNAWPKGSLVRVLKTPA